MAQIRESVHTSLYPGLPLKVPFLLLIRLHHHFAINMWCRLPLAIAWVLKAAYSQPKDQNEDNILWETHVVMQVIKHFQALGKNRPLWFWRTVHGAEVDLLIEQGGRFIAVEAKFSENTDLKALKGINALKKFYGEKSVIAGFIASRTENSYPVSEKVHAIPGSDIDEYL